MMQRINSGQRARAILGTLALAALVILNGPVSAAHAAGPPDYMAVLEAASWSASPGQTFNVTAFYMRKTTDNGPFKVALYLQKGFGAPTINAAGDYHVIGGIDSATGPDLDLDDNRDYQKLHVN